MNDYKLNIKQSPEDNRDLILKTNSHKYPNTLDFRPFLNEVRNQGTQGSCFAFAVSCMKEFQEQKDYKFEGYMSPQFFYDVRSNLYDDDKNNDEGMFGRDVMKILTKIGICTEKEYPYGIENSKHKDKIDKAIYESAYKHKCISYAKVNSIQDLKRSLYKNGPCLICVPVYNYGPTMWQKEHYNQKMIGGHAMCIVGYTKNSFIIRNSWGKNWQDDGYCYFPFKHWGSHWEAWTTIDSNTTTNSNNDILISDEWELMVKNIDKVICGIAMITLISGFFFIH
jgi:C1A family cysteine protease